MKMKNEEEKNRLSVELCYNHQFHRSDSSILDHLRYENIFQKYSFNRKISNKVYRCLTLKGSKKQQKKQPFDNQPIINVVRYLLIELIFFKNFFTAMMI